MKGIATTSFIFILIFMTSAALVCGAQTAQKQADWTKYDSPEGRYSILFPCKPDLSTQEAPAKTGQKLTQYFATCDDPGPASITYSAAYFDLQQNMGFSFDEARDGYLKAVNATLQSEKTIHLDANQGREYRASAKVSGADLLLVARFYLVEQRIYLIQFIYEKSAESASTTEKSVKFFDSFALTSSH
jgi:hypothetical protein